MSAAPLVDLLLEPDPYEDVREVQVIWKEGAVDIDYYFVKNEGCRLDRFSVVGIGILPDYLEFKDKTGLEELQGKQFDRDPGEQGLSITVLLEGFDIIELRTIHTCGKDRVSKVFARLERPWTKPNP